MAFDKHCSDMVVFYGRFNMAHLPHKTLRSIKFAIREYGTGLVMTSKHMAELFTYDYGYGYYWG